MSKLTQYYYNGVVEAQRMVIQAMMDQDDYRLQAANRILEHAKEEYKKILLLMGEL